MLQCYIWMTSNGFTLWGAMRFVAQKIQLSFATVYLGEA